MSEWPVADKRSSGTYNNRPIARLYKRKEQTLVGLFEQHPWLLVPLVIVTVELWNALKANIARRVGGGTAKR